MKVLNKILAFLINLILIIIMISPTVLALQYQPTNYLALGDSIAYGYGLTDRNSQSYPQIIRKKCNISENNFSNLAVSGMTCAEFYEIIQTEKYTNAIKKLDFITISIGSNELLKVAINALSDTTGVVSTDPDFARKVKDYFASLNYLEKVRIAYQLYSYFTSNETKQLMNNNISTYEHNWKKSIDYIKSINPEANIIATEFYNPYYEVGLESYDLGSYVDEYIIKMNNILKNQSNSETNYKIAKIYDDFNTTNPRLTNVYVEFGDFDNLNIDPHPNKDGHSIIATRVLDALETIKIDSKKDIKECTIEDINDYQYTGNEIKPILTIKNGNTTLVENTDYTLTYIDNIKIGKATILIKGIGNYTGSVTKNFNIKNEETTNKLNINDMSYSTVEDQQYIGIKITPDVQIKKFPDKNLVKNTDYNLRYYDNINVGIATIEIIGIGNYTGTKKVNFNITPRDISYAVIENIEDQKYTGEEISPTIKITDGSAQLIENKDYELSYKNNTQIGNATIEVKGLGNYTGNVEKQFKIVEEQSNNNLTNISNLNITPIEDKIYTGKVITPEVVIMDGDKTLIKDKDYNLNFNNNLNVGTGTIIISGIGDYTGLRNETFKIIKKDINFTQIEDISNQKYTGEKITPEIVITSDFIKLKEGQDYTIEYSNNTNVGTAKVTILGINNYTGKTIKTFNIVSEDNTANDNKEGNIKTKATNVESKDNTLSNQILPYAGTIKFAILLIILFINGLFFYYRYYRNRDI